MAGIDVRKAFNSVSHERLVEMMRLYQGDACINPIAWMGKPQRGTGC